MAEGITPDQLAQYIEASAELRKLITEAHQAIRDLRHEKKELRELRQSYLTNEDLKVKLDEAVGRGLATFNQALKSAIDDATQRVYDRFDTIMLICLGEDPVSVREGRRTVTELVTEFIRQRNLPIRVSEEVYLAMSPETKAREEHRIKKVFHAPLPSGRDVGSLPIVTDRRMKPGLALLVIPPEQDGERRVAVEINLDTGEGAAAAADELRSVWDRNQQQIPAAFRKDSKQGGRRKPA